MPKCKACKAPIEWAVTDDHKAIPLDAEPNDDGNMVLTGETGVVWSTGRSGPKARNIGAPGLFPDEPGTVRRMPHHATCPDVDQFRQ